jgi:hypothetical protein
MKQLPSRCVPAAGVALAFLAFAVEENLGAL